MNQQRNHWGVDSSGNSIEHYTLSNDHGMVIGITNYGAIITSIQTPDKYGVLDEIALGFDSLAPYLADGYIHNCPMFGAIAGRYANRIAKGHFVLDGKAFQLATNNLGNALHGGIQGFDKRLWQGKLTAGHDFVGVELSYLSPHPEEGYPGNLAVTVAYTLNNRNEIVIVFGAATDRATVVNLTNHTYFNLSGCRAPITDHILTVNSQHIIETQDLIPTGNLMNISGTVYDFSAGKSLGRDIHTLPIGYDTGYVLKTESGACSLAALLQEELSGRQVEVFTTEPSIQLYTGFFIPEVKGHHGINYGKLMGVALETQHFPDSPNHSHFPTTTLRPGKPFSSQTIYRFGLIPQIINGF